jgi:hypothetical protein
LAAAAAAAAVAVLLTLPATAVYGRMRAAERALLRQSSRRSGRRRRFGGGGGGDGGGSARSSRFLEPISSGGGSPQLSTPFLQSLSDVMDEDQSEISAAFFHRVYFTGCNSFGDPWRLSPDPPAAVRPLLRAEEWSRLVRACSAGAPASWGGIVLPGGGRGGGGGRGLAGGSAAGGGGGSGGLPLDGSGQLSQISSGGGGSGGGGGKRPNQCYGGTLHSRWAGAVHVVLMLACPPVAAAWLSRARRRAAADIATLIDHYDRCCLRSARARALQEGLAFGASADATTAWLDFFVQGDEEEGTIPPELSRGAAAEGAAGTALSGRLPMPVVFSGDGSFESPWQWAAAGDDPAGEGLPAALLDLTVPGVACGEVEQALRGFRARLGACRKLPRGAESRGGEGGRGGGREGGGRGAARGGGISGSVGVGEAVHRATRLTRATGTCFTFALTPPEVQPSNPAHCTLHPAPCTLHPAP